MPEITPSYLSRACKYQFIGQTKGDQPPEATKRREKDKKREGERVLSGEASFLFPTARGSQETSWAISPCLVTPTPTNPS
jgi:hypothetical protein